MKKLILLTISLLVFSSLFAQYKKGFKYLDKNDLESAKVIFDEYLEINRNDPVANYGVSQVFFNQKYIGHDLFKAFHHIMIAQRNYSTYQNAQNDKIDQLFSKEILDKAKKEIDGKLYLHVLDANDISLSEKFIASCNGSDYMKEIIDLRNKLEFEKAKTYNTIAVYKNFIQKYPYAKESPEAKNILSELVYKNAEKENSIESYTNYISEYPKSDYTDKAKSKLLKLEYDMALIINTVDAYSSFLKKYPESIHSAEIEKLRDSIAYFNVKRLNTLNAYQHFIDNYPNSNKISEIKWIRDSLAYEKALELGTIKALKDFVEKYPDASQVPDALKKQGIAGLSQQRLNEKKEQRRISNSKIKKIKIYKTDYESPEPPKLELIETIEYNEKGLLISSLKKVNGENELITKKYNNESDQLIQKIYKASKVSFITEPRYNEDGYIIEEKTTCKSNPSVVCFNYITTYEYDDKKNLIKKVEYTTDNDTNEVICYFYDNKGNIIKEKSALTDPDGIQEETKIEYTYNPHNQLLQKITYSGDNKIESVETLKYGKSSSLIAKISYGPFGETKTEYAYGPKGFKTKESVYNRKTDKLKHTLDYHYEYFE